MNSCNFLGRACLFLKLLNFVFNFNLTLELQESKRANENFYNCFFFWYLKTILIWTFLLLCSSGSELIFCHIYWYYSFVQIMITGMHQVNWLKSPKYVHNTIYFNQKICFWKKSTLFILIFILLSLCRVALYIFGITFEVKVLI